MTTDLFFKKSIEYFEKIINSEDIKIELKELLGEEYLLNYTNKSVDLTIFNENSYLNDKYKIVLNILNNENIIGDYILYLNKQGNFIDEFLVWR